MDYKLVKNLVEFFKKNITILSSDDALKVQDSKSNLSEGDSGDYKMNFLYERPELAYFINGL